MPEYLFMTCHVCDETATLDPDSETVAVAEMVTFVAAHDCHEKCNIEMRVGTSAPSVAEHPTG